MCYIISQSCFLYDGVLKEELHNIGTCVDWTSLWKIVVVMNNHNKSSQKNELLRMGDITLCPLHTDT